MYKIKLAPWQFVDLATFNTAGRNRFPPSVKPAELECKVDHMITSLRIVHKRYGDKVIADLEYADIGKKTMLLKELMVNQMLVMHQDFFPAFFLPKWTDGPGEK
uniref:Uncharacterized protein n=1 Tax=Trichogramma kaykai TaxID=54128 RepID=A0ABD2XBS6_9HYME